MRHSQHLPLVVAAATGFALSGCLTDSTAPLDQAARPTRTAALVQAQLTTLVEPVLTASQSNVVFTDIGGGNVQITFNGVFDFSAIGGGAETYSATFSYNTSVPPFATPPDPNVDIAFYALDVVNVSIFGGAVTPTFVSVLIQDGAGIFGDFFTLTVLFSSPGLPIPNTSQGLIAIGLNAGAFPGTMFSSTAFPTNLDIFASAIGAGAPTHFAEVSPLTPQDAIRLLTDDVETLLSEGLLSQDQRDGLMDKLTAAIRSLDRGDTKAGCNQLRAFVIQVNALINAGKLTEGTGRGLTDSAESVRSRIGCV